MGTEPKSKLLSLRLSPNHYEYVRLQARERNMSVSEFMRVIIERAENEFRPESPSRTEVLNYLKNLSAPQRETLLDKVDSGEKRKIILYMNKILEEKPETTVEKLCKSTSTEFRVPVNLDLRRTADLRIRSYRTKRKFVERLERENEELSRSIREKSFCPDAEPLRKPECPRGGEKMERTLSIVKPDGVEKNLIGEVLRRFESEGIKVAALKMIRMSKKQAEGFYHVHRERPFYSSLTDFMSSGPCVVMALEGEDAISKVRTIMGATNPEEAEKGTIRKDFASGIERNVVHGSDSPESAAYEIGYFFPRLEVQD